MEITNHIIWPIVAGVMSLSIFIWAGCIRKKNKGGANYLVVIGILSLLMVPFLLSERLIIEDQRLIYHSGFGPLAETRIAKFEDYKHASLENRYDSNGNLDTMWIFEKPSGEQHTFKKNLMVEQCNQILKELRARSFVVHDRR